MSKSSVTHTAEYSRARNLKHGKRYRDGVARLIDSLKTRLSVPYDLASTETVLEVAVAALQTASLCSMGCSHDGSDECAFYQLMKES